MTRTMQVVAARPLSPLAAAVAEPANSAAETEVAYGDRQMAAYGVEPSHWATDVLQDARDHLATSMAYPEHAARIRAELARRSPDAALLALCARLAEMQAEWQRLYDATSDKEEITTAADRAWQQYSDDVWPRTALQPRGSNTPDVPALLMTQRATTREGLAAKAAAILALDAAASYCDLWDDSMDLCMSLVRDAAGSAFGPLGAEAAQSATPLRSAAAAA